MLVALTTLLHAPAAMGRTPSDGRAATAASPARARTEIVFGILGSVDDSSREALTGLLRAELERLGLTLVERDPSSEARGWAREIARNDAALLGALLDGREGAFRVVVIDAERDRAIARELPGGLDRESANLEAVVSIVLSAAHALREGLEVASTPVDAVVGSPPLPPSPVRKAREAPPAPSPERAGTTLHAGVSAVLATLAGGAEPTVGASFDAGAFVASIWSVDLAYTRHDSRTIESEFGTFSVARSGLSLSSGPVFRMGRFALNPALGATLEWLVRHDTRPVGGVTAEDDRTLSRAGGFVVTRARFALFERADAEFVSIGALVGAAYFGERVRFRAGERLLTEARRVAFSGEIGLFAVTGSL